MSVYGASFVEAIPDSDAAFRETCRLIQERNATWLAASPTHLASEHTVRATGGSSWISIQNAVGDDVLQSISSTLNTTAVTLYAIDEIKLVFNYRRLHAGRTVRRLEYGEDETTNRGRWTRVEGERESWEDLLFSERLLESYMKFHSDVLQQVRSDKAIKLGCSIPWACDGTTVAEIAKALHLPWQPLGDTFPAALQIETIPGSPERWKAFHREHRKPWWKFW